MGEYPSLRRASGGFTFMKEIEYEGITLKAFANFSPGLRFGNPGYVSSPSPPTLKGLRRR